MKLETTENNLEIKHEVNYNNFMKQYNLEHKYCPVCGSTEHTQTLMVYVFYSDKPEEYKNKNMCCCVKCGDRHIFHDRIDHRADTILNKIENETVFKFGISELGNRIKITELCGECHSVELTKIEALKMVQEIMNIINKLK